MCRVRIHELSPRNTFKDLAQILLSNQSLFFPLRKKYIPTDENKQTKNFFSQLTLQLSAGSSSVTLQPCVCKVLKHGVGLSSSWTCGLSPWPSASTLLSVCSSSKAHPTESFSVCNSIILAVEVYTGLVVPETF